MRHSLKILAAALLMAPSLTLAAKPTIAVLAFDVDTRATIFGENYVTSAVIEDKTHFLTGDLVTQLVKSRRFDVVERSRVDDLMKEQEFSDSGFISAETAVQVGKMIGADYFVMGKIEHLQAGLETKAVPYGNGKTQQQGVGEMIVNLRVVDSRGGKIVAAEKFTIEFKETKVKSPGVFVENLREQAAREIVSTVVERVFPLKVVSVANGIAVINRGGGASFKVGTALAVYEQGEEIKDPDTDESLGFDEAKIGELKVIEVLDKTSKAEIVSGADVIKKGTVVRVLKTDPAAGSKAFEGTAGSSDKPARW